MDIVRLGELPSADTHRNSPAAFKVTDIKSAAKSDNRVNIYIDGKYDFSLDIAQLVDYKIKVGTTLTYKQLNDYRHASEFGKLYQRTLEWVLTRPHSIAETKEYLKRKLKKRELENRQAIYNRDRTKEDREKYHLHTKELPLFTPDDIENVISRLIERGYLDDAKFASYYLENRFVKKGISRKRLELELAQKGIDKEIVQETLANSERDDEAEIKKIIAKKRNRYDDDKLIAYLTRQGFSYQLSKDLVLGTD